MVKDSPTGGESWRDIAIPKAILISLVIKHMFRRQQLLLLLLSFSLILFSVSHSIKAWLACPRMAQCVCVFFCWDGNGNCFGFIWVIHLKKCPTFFSSFLRFSRHLSYTEHKTKGKTKKDSKAINGPASGSET